MAGEFDAYLKKYAEEHQPVQPESDFERWKKAMGYGDYNPENQQSGGFLDSAVRAVKSGAAGVAQGAAQFGNVFGIGDGQFADYMREVGQNNARKKEYELADMTPFASDYWTNPEGAMYDVGNMLGSALALGAATAAVSSGIGAAAGAVGLSATGAGAVAGLAGKMAQVASKAGMPVMAKVFNSPLGKAFALNIMKTPLEAMTEGGQAGAEALEEGEDRGEAQKRALQVMGMQMPFLAFSNTLESAGLAGILGKEASKVTGKAIAKGGLAKVLQGLTFEALQNAYEEGFQQSTQEYVKGEQSGAGMFNPFAWSEEAKQQAGAGAVGGLAIGGAAHVANAGINRMGKKRQNQNQAANAAAEETAAPQTPVERAREYLDNAYESAPEEAKQAIGEAAESDDPNVVLEAAQKLGWNPQEEAQVAAGAQQAVTDAPEQVSAASTIDEQRQAATDAVNEKVAQVAAEGVANANNDNLALQSAQREQESKQAQAQQMQQAQQAEAEPVEEEMVAQAPMKAPVAPAVAAPVAMPAQAQQGTSAPKTEWTYKPTPYAETLKRNVSRTLAQDKKDKKGRPKYIKADGSFNAPKLRSNLLLAPWVNAHADMVEVAKKALSGDKNAIKQFKTLTPLRQAALIDAAENGIENYKLTPQKEQWIQQHNEQNRAGAVKNLRNAVLKKIKENPALGEREIDGKRVAWIAEHGNEQILMQAAKALNVNVPSSLKNAPAQVKATASTSSSMVEETPAAVTAEARKEETKEAKPVEAEEKSAQKQEKQQAPKRQEQPKQQEQLKQQEQPKAAQAPAQSQNLADRAFPEISLGGRVFTPLISTSGTMVELNAPKGMLLTKAEFQSMRDAGFSYKSGLGIVAQIGDEKANAKISKFLRDHAPNKMEARDKGGNENNGSQEVQRQSDTGNRKSEDAVHRRSEQEHKANDESKRENKTAPAAVEEKVAETKPTKEKAKKENPATKQAQESKPVKSGVKFVQKQMKAPTKSPKKDANGITTFPKQDTASFKQIPAEQIQEIQNQNSEIMLNKAKAIAEDFNAGKLSSNDACKAITQVYQKYRQSEAKVKVYNDGLLDAMDKIKSDIVKQAQASVEERFNPAIKEVQAIVEQHAKQELSAETAIKKANEIFQKLSADMELTRALEREFKENITAIRRKETEFVKEQRAQLNPTNEIKEAAKSSKQARDHLQNILDGMIDNLMKTVDVKVRDNSVPAKFIKAWEGLMKARALAYDYYNPSRLFTDHPLEVQVLNNSAAEYVKTIYHGTSATDLTKFESSKVGSMTGLQHGWGVYFTADYGEAKRYSNNALGDLSDRFKFTYDGKELDFGITEAASKQDAFVERICNVLKVMDGNEDFDFDKKNNSKAFLSKFDEYRRKEIKSIQKEIRNAKNAKEEAFLKEQVADLSQADASKINWELTYNGIIIESLAPDSSALLDEDVEVLQQAPVVRKALTAEFNKLERKTPEEIAEMQRLTGAEAYKTLVGYYKGDQELVSRALGAHGVEGITYFDPQDKRCFVFFNPEAVKVLKKYNASDEENNTKNNILIKDKEGKDKEGKVKGDILFDNEKTIIRLFANAKDPSVIIHETGHYFTEALARDVKEGRANEQQIQDWNTLLDYGGITQEQWNSGNAALKRQAHERWAEGFESYIMEGKAPVEGALQKIFESFKRWLHNAYRLFRANLKEQVQRGEEAIPLTDAVRKVFDNMLTPAETEEISLIQEFLDKNSGELRKSSFEGKIKLYDELINEVNNLYDKDGKIIESKKAKFDQQLRAASKDPIGALSPKQEAAIKLQEIRLEAATNIAKANPFINAAKERYEEATNEEEDNIILAADQLVARPSSLSDFKLGEEGESIDKYLLYNIPEDAFDVLAMSLDPVIYDVDPEARKYYEEVALDDAVFYGKLGKDSQEELKIMEESGEYDKDTIAVLKEYGNLLVKTVKKSQELRLTESRTLLQIANHEREKMANKARTSLLKNNVEAQRAREDIIGRIKKEFGSSDVKQNSSGDLLFTTPTGDKYLVKVEDRIVVNESLAAARQEHGISADKELIVQGLYRPLSDKDVKGILSVATYSKPGVETHEVTHAAINNALSKKESDALFKRAKQLIKEQGSKQDAEEMACDAVQAYVLARENGYVTTFTQAERTELAKTSWGKTLLNLNKAGRKAQLFSALNQERLGNTAWGKAILAKYKLQAAMAKLFRKIYDFVKAMQGVFSDVDNFHNVARRIESGEVWANTNAEKRNSGDKYQAVGVKSLTADRKRLELAREMENNGETRESIYNKTRWWRGLDGYWRYEIPDALSKFNFDALNNEEQSASLPEVYPYDTLYASYPKLKDITVSLRNLEEGCLGEAYDTKIYLSKDIAKKINNSEPFSNHRIFHEKRLSKTLLHEIQHIIQKYEGFASGGSEDTFWYFKEYGEDLRKIYKQELRRAYKKLAPDADKKIGPKMHGLVRNLGVIEDIEDTGLYLDIEDVEKKKEILQAIKAIKDQYKEQYTEKRRKKTIDELFDDILYYENALTGFNTVDLVEGLATVHDTPRDYRVYRALHGEQESRRAEFRADPDVSEQFYPWMDENLNEDMSIIYREKDLAKIKFRFNFDDVFSIAKNKNNSGTRYSLRAIRKPDKTILALNEEYKDKLKSAILRKANNNEIAAIMNEHQEKMQEHVTEKAVAAKERSKVRAKELRELRSKFAKGEIDQYDVGGVTIGRDEDGEEVVREVTNDFAKRTYANNRHEGKEYASVAEEMQDIIHTADEKGPTKSKKEWLEDQFKNFYRNWIDKYTDMGVFDKAYSEAVGRVLESEETMKSVMQFTQNTADGHTHALISGDEEHMKIMQKKFGLKHAISFRMIIDDVKKDTESGKFNAYMEKNFPSKNKNDVSSVIDAWGGYLIANGFLEAANNHRMDYNKEVTEWKADGQKGKEPQYTEYKMPAGMTEAKCAEIVRNAPAAFKRYSQMFYDFNENNLQIMERSGLITKEQHELLNSRYKAYCPLMRDFSDTEGVDTFVGQLSSGKGIANVVDPMQRRRSGGSTRDIISPLEVTLKATACIMSRCARNNAGQELVARAQEANLEGLVQLVEGNTGDAKNCIFTVMEDGVKRAYRTTQELYPCVTQGFEPGVKLQLGFFTKPAQLLRAGSTLSPSFIIRNFLRDTIFASVSSKNGFIPIYDSLRGAHALWTNQKFAAEFDVAGVISSNFYNTREAAYQSLEEMAGGELKNYSGLELIKAMAKSPIKFFAFLSENIEASTRAGEFLRAREKGKPIEAAGHDAVEVTLNFGRSGVIGQQVNQGIPFFNACLQGGDKLYRLFREDPIGTSAKLGAYIILPSIALWAINHDEDWYKELDPNIKATCWVLPNGIRIPKPQEAGVLFGTGAEAVLASAFENDPKSVGSWIDAFIDNMAPGFIPTVLLPLIEWQSNYSFFRGKPIVNASQQKLPEEMQFGNYTSEVSKFAGKQLGLSPLKLDNAVRSVAGTMGMALVQAPDMMFADKQNLPEKKFSEIAVVRDFLVNDMNMTRTMNDFYELQSIAAKEHNAHGKKGSPSPAVKAINKAYSLIGE